MRSRNIKPGFFKNEVLCEIEPIGRLLFEGLWCIADREGRLQDRPRKIWAEVLPYDPYNGDELLWQLHDKGFIVRYEVGPRNFIWIPTFKDHQNPHHNESPSVLPDVSAGCTTSRHGSKSLLPCPVPAVLDSLIPGFSDSLIPREKHLPEETSDVLTLVPNEPIPIKKREPSQEEKLAAQYAPAIHARHVARKCSLKAVREKLAAILRRVSKEKQFELVETIDRNHKANCASEDWTKEGGQYCPGLEKWLNPPTERYLVAVPPARASPAKVDPVAALMQKRIDEGWQCP